MTECQSYSWQLLCLNKKIGCCDLVWNSKGSSKNSKYEPEVLFSSLNVRLSWSYPFITAVSFALWITMQNEFINVQDTCLGYEITTCCFKMGAVDNCAAAILIESFSLEPVFCRRTMALDYHHAAQRFSWLHIVEARHKTAAPFDILNYNSLKYLPLWYLKICNLVACPK